MRWSRRMLLAGAIVITTINAQEKSAYERNSRGWQDLLADGSLLQWTRVPLIGAQQANPALQPESPWTFEAARNTLCCAGGQGRELFRFERELGDFLLHVEWRLQAVSGERQAGSGIHVRNSVDGQLWHQAQAGDGGGYLFANSLVNGEIRRINLSKHVSEQRVRPAGEWNTYEISVKGREIHLWINGAETNVWSECEVPSGYIALEAKGASAEFRSVQLKELA